jgi:aspartate aminotransferase
MKQQVPERFQKLTPSPTLTLSARVKEMARQGRDVVNLTAGEPDQAPPDFVLDAVRDADLVATTRYTDSRGLADVRKVTAEWIAREIGVQYAPEEVLLLDGAKQALALGIHAMFEKGEELVIFTPTWVSYVPMCHLAGVEPALVATDVASGFRPDLENLEQRIGPHTAGLLLNSPQNPTGIVYTDAELDGLADFVRRHDLLLISDEIYAHIRLAPPADGPVVRSILARHPDLKERTLMVNSLSKTYAVPGWRVGFAAGPRWLIDRMTLAWGHIGSNLNALMQHVLKATLSRPTDFMQAWNAEYRQRRDLALELLAEIPGLKVHPAEGAFYLFPDVRAYLGKSGPGHCVTSSMQLAEYLLDTVGVATVPGEAFEAPGYLRMTLAASREKIADGLARMRDAMGKLQ